MTTAAPSSVDNTTTKTSEEIAQIAEIEATLLPIPAKKGTVNYLTNKEILSEIHKSKLSYCSFQDTKYAAYDAIVATHAEITDALVAETKIRKAHLQTQAEKARLREAGRKQSEIKAVEISPDSIKTEDVVFRVMTSAHIPLDPLRKRRGKGENANHTKTPFYPFKHYIIVDNELVEVLRSHWQGDIATGEFNMIHGTMTQRLALMFIMLVDRYSRRANWRSYTYLDEMKSHALLQLSQVGLQFDEYKSDNPFAFYTTILTNCFTRILNLEKKNQNIRDDILIMNGAAPSYTRLNDYEYERGLKAHNALYGPPVIEGEEPVAPKNRFRRAKKKVEVEAETESDVTAEIDVTDLNLDSDSDIISTMENLDPESLLPESYDNLDDGSFLSDPDIETEE